MNDVTKTRSPVTPESINACGKLCIGLGAAIKGAAAVGDKSTVRELSAELLRVSKSLTWLLREDRGTIAAARAGGTNGA